MLVDSHCHLADEAFREDLAAVVERARVAGVSRLLCILSADEPEELARGAVVAALWPAVAVATGVHPHRAGEFAGRAGDAAACTRRAVAGAAACAIGEIGLDYHYDFSPRDAQREVFEAQVALAVELDLPVVIHSREATPDTLAALAAPGPGLVRGVLHCFTGTAPEAGAALALGLYVSLAGIVTFPRAGALRDVARRIPADRLLVETDAPYLAPVPHRGRRNEPAWVAATLRAVAAARGDDVGVLSAQIARNFEALFGRRVDTPAKPMV